MELEQLAHRPQRDVVDFFEVEGRVDFRGHALQDLKLAAWRASCAVLRARLRIVLDAISTSERHLADRSRSSSSREPACVRSVSGYGTLSTESTR